MYQRITATLLAAFLFLSLGCTKQPKTSITAQQKATHLIQFLDKNDETVASCTGTAIGPAAFITAMHCVEDGDVGTDIRIDFSTHVYKAVHAATDGRDHLMVALSESPFKNTIDISSHKPFIVGEKVHIYGCGGRQFPCELKEGTLSSRDEISDVDQSVQYGYYSIGVIPGDSGSVVYNANNEPVAMITYGVREYKTFFYYKYTSISAGGFDLDFSQRQIDMAKNFNPEAEAKNVNQSDTPAPSDSNKPASQ